MFTLPTCRQHVKTKDHDQHQNVNQKENFIDNKDDDTDKNDNIDRLTHAYHDLATQLGCVIFNEPCCIFVHFLCFSSFTTIYHMSYFEDENCVSNFKNVQFVKRNIFFSEIMTPMFETSIEITKKHHFS